MKKKLLLLILILPVLSFSTSIKENFISKKYLENVRLDLSSIDEGEESLYAGLSHFAVSPEVPLWQRGFYLLKRSGKHEANILNHLKREFPEIFSDHRRLTIFLVYSVYNQMYDIFFRLMDEEYEDYANPGNLDQRWDRSEELRHFFKANRLHPKYLNLAVEGSNKILAETKPPSSNGILEFDYSDKGLAGIYWRGEEIFKCLESASGFFLGPNAVKSGTGITAKEEDLDSGYLFEIKFNGIKAGYMIQYLKDSGDYLELFVSLRTKGLVKALFSVKDDIYVKMDKKNLRVMQLSERIREGKYEADRLTLFDNMTMTARYNKKERIYFAGDTRDSYSAMYLLKWLLPEKIRRISLISRKRVYPFGLKYKNSSEKINGNKKKGVWVIPEYSGKRELKEDISPQFFFDLETGLPLRSLTKTSYGTLEATYKKKIGFEEYKELGGNYEDFSN